jgi:phage N-6-adenine-methyltransferase
MNDVTLQLFEGSSLARYDAMCRAIADARAINWVLAFRNEAEGWRAAARIAKDREAEIAAAEIRLRAERRVGELIAEQRKVNGLAKPPPGPGRGKVGSKTDPSFNGAPTLDDVGIGKHLADRARRLAALSAGDFDHRIEVWREDARMGKFVGLDVLSNKPRGTQGTGENEWYTPTEWLDRARAVLGGFDLDPASSRRAQRTVKAEKFFTLDTDGLTKQWHGRVWMNPPYAQPAIGDFAEKLAAEFEAGRVTSAIALTHNYTDTRWFHRLANGAAAICFPLGRIRFVAPDGSLAAPTQGQALFYFGKAVELFQATFVDAGVVLRVPP